MSGTDEGFFKETNKERQKMILNDVITRMHGSAYPMEKMVYRLLEKIDQVLDHPIQKWGHGVESHQLIHEYGGIISYNNTECQIDPKIDSESPWLVKKGNDGRLYWRARGVFEDAHLCNLIGLAEVYNQPVGIITGCCLNTDGQIEALSASNPVNLSQVNYTSTSIKIFKVSNYDVYDQVIRHSGDTKWVVLAFDDSIHYTGDIHNGDNTRKMRDVFMVTTSCYLPFSMVSVNAVLCHFLMAIVGWGIVALCYFEEDVGTRA